MMQRLLAVLHARNLEFLRDRSTLTFTLVLPVLLELPRQEFPQAARGLPLRILDASDRVEITTDDLEGTLRTLLAAKVPLSNLRIRPANLEDLFLELTGTELRP